ncbi:hypothetical protein J2Y45_006861 [Dyadobacter sp. BE34]|uniref:Uncharacterized protein n=1 Tax=Dyadobacter fermentans TaxID=94254 RepID=A0ABU1R8R9_9BACT|nr:hypothetical protein [Dyadobacter fermentans]MDR7047527.1 hypothetical protein [Dyadobacter sp. BE242]MDR7201697.1 hypothetical protein [Dyadobacter sp. BE34]MDR7219567.1 hypothetical protein [Dyadobacter sp. BE31]MDR7267310.1 hypothetical protein [Dyadobacter sp. BE32]
MNFHKYFLSLEKRFIELSGFVYIHPDNDAVYSTEIALLYLTVCSEFEVVSKALCKAIDSSQNDLNIHNIRAVINGQMLTRSFFDEGVAVSGYDYPTVFPFIEWTDQISPTWWKSYNKVKHDRFARFPEANLRNLLYAFAALHVANFYLNWHPRIQFGHRRHGTFQLDPPPAMFRIHNVDYEGPWFSNELEGL